MKIKKLSTYIILLSLLVLGWYCSDNSVSNSSKIIFERDSLSMNLLDTSYGYVDPVPYSLGSLGGKLNLAFDCETNLDSIIGIPYVSVYLHHNGPTHDFEATFNSYSKSEINGHHSFDINTSLAQFNYSLNIILKIYNPHNYGVLKYVTITNFKLTQN
jgi:hypothetical protein